ncbi:hypothetical protein BDP27DRAFT_1323448 [Rhodocollybia butyracea]|uniref:Uncharacterized protein n=1 Tax=Rhodocollybia butyracea TaxID=206335 RepID=A0A9P5U839_9AGAR|nr:hypothetical protein BDP27DRAFT_1323448 [Rhodocollybia butyracea]
MAKATKRKAKFIVNPESEAEDSVLIISRADPMPSSIGNTPPTPHSPNDNDSRKKIRLSSPESSLDDEVPGSVSGEEEIIPVPRTTSKAAVSKESVVKWRESNSDVSEKIETTADDSISPQRATPLSYHRLTPPPTSTMKTLAPLDVNTKTQQLIAEIRAKALVAARSSPIEEAKPFRETLSDSDSDDDLRPLEISVKGKGKQVAQTASDARPTRYNTRSNNPQPSSSKSKQPSVSPTVIRSDRRKSRSDPFTALLKEKRDEEKSGRSAFHYSKAAEIASQIPLETDDEDDLDDSASPSKASASLELEDLKVDLDEGDRKRLFGDQGEEIKVILDKDQEKREADELQQSRVGASFWRENDDDNDVDVDMDVELAMDFGKYSQQPVLCLLYNAFKSHDFAQASAVLSSGLLNTVNLELFPGVIDYLCYIALSPSHENLSSDAFNALLNVWDTSHTPMPGISLQIILNAVSRLGAKSDILKLKGSHTPNLDDERREDLVFRLVKLIESSARSRLLNVTTIPQVVLVLLAISLDTSTSTALQKEIAVALDTMFQSIADPNVVAEIEPAICNQILLYVSNFNAVNTSHIITLLASGVGRSIRIARWVARSVLLVQNEVKDLIPILTPGVTTPCQVFQVRRDSDYVEMGHYVQILAVALTDIPSYIPRQIAAAAALKAGRPVMNSPSKEKIETPLERLETCMTFVHRQITDTGTNIERSRTKAALQHLTLRLGYQLKAGTKSDKPTGILGYFEKRNVA